MQQLVLWLPQFSGLEDDDNAGAVLAGAFHQFEQNHPGVNIDVQVKAEQGIASIFNLLRGAQTVAPSILPDIVLLDTQQLWQVVDLGIVAPITEDELGRNENTYQFAMNAVVYRDARYAAPYAADIVHLVYDENLPQRPETWADILAMESVYLFPGSGGNGYGNVSILLQYVGAGGELLEDGTISNPQAIENVFDFLVEARASGVIPASAAEISTLDGAWSAFLAGEADVANIAASDFLLRYEALPTAGYSSVPTQSGEAITIARTWAFAVLTNDTSRRELAFDLIRQLDTPEIQGEWTQFAQRLPTRRSTLQAWNNPAPYISFLDQQLESAVSIPNGLAFAQFAQRLQEAQHAILLGTTTSAGALQMVLINE